MSIKIPKQILLPALAVLAFFTFPAPGFAQTPQPIPVTNNLDFTPPATPISGSLRDAVSKANDGDTVAISATVTAPIILTGGVIQILKDITVQGAGAGGTILDGNTTNPIFEIGNNSIPTPAAASVKIIGVTIRNGLDGNSQDGGGIRVDKSSSLRLEDSHIGPNNTSVTVGGGIASEGFLTVVNSTIEGNHGLADGGIVCLGGGTLDLKNTIVSNNLSDEEGGGGIGVTSGCKSALIDACIISGNTTTKGSGGGIDNGASTTILNSVITGNHAPEATTTGGGGIANFSVIKIDRTTISNNNTTGAGGGIFNGSGTALTITNTTISGNHSNGANSAGGGIALQKPATTPTPLDISNTTVFRNDATGGGGGIFNNNENLHLNNVTIANNTADKDKDNIGDGGGIDGVDPTKIRNTLIADNLDLSDQSSGGVVDNDCNFELVSEGHNLIGVVGADCDISGDTSGNITNQPAGLDPGGLQANGSTGPMTVALVAGSRAIDAGDPATAAATDERGFLRQGLAPDIGAFEFGGAPSPTPTPTPGQNNGNSGGCALVATADFGFSGLMSLLPLAAVSLAALRRRAK